MSECENRYCGNTAPVGEPFCGKCADEIGTYYGRKQMLSDIRTDLALAMSDDVTVVMGRGRAYYLREAVSKLTQLVEDLHDLG